VRKTITWLSISHSESKNSPILTSSKWEKPYRSRLVSVFLWSSKKEMVVKKDAKDIRKVRAM